MDLLVCRLVTQSCPTLCDPMTVAHQVSLSFRDLLATSYQCTQCNLIATCHPPDTGQRAQVRWPVASGSSWEAQTCLQTQAECLEREHPGNEVITSRTFISRTPSPSPGSAGRSTPSRAHPWVHAPVLCSRHWTALGRRPPSLVSPVRGQPRAPRWEPRRQVRRWRSAGGAGSRF